MFRGDPSPERTYNNSPAASAPGTSDINESSPKGTAELRDVSDLSLADDIAIY